MASLNTLRTKFGIVLSIVIALALLAFILSLKTEMGFSGNDPQVGEINGEKIRYSEYYNQYEQIKQRNNAQEGGEEQAAMLANAVWQTLLADRVMAPGFEAMGLRITEPERLALISGEQYSQVMYGAFSDPRTGAFNVNAVNQFLAQAESNPQAAQMWAQLTQQARLEREMQKYIGLIKGGAYVNALEVANGVAAANNTYAGQWTGKKFVEVADSLVAVSSSEIKAYYKKNKKAFRQLPSRSLSYVVFEVAPTEDDMLALEKTVQQVGAEFAASTEPKTFVRANRNGKVAESFVSAAQLTSDEATALMADGMYGPVLKNNEWTMSRVLESKLVPDSLGVRHIVLPYTQEALADSLINVIKQGGDFAQLAAQYSVSDATAANGGEVGVLPFSVFTGEFATALSNAKQGDVVKIPAGEAIQIMQVYRADNPVKQVLLATITYPVEASETTRRDIHNQAGTFSVNAKGSIETFNEAATTAAITPRVATLSQGERSIGGVEDSRDVAVWVYGAEKGAVSEIFNVGKNYVVAMLTDIDEKEYAPVDKVASQIRSVLLRDKKYDYIVKQIAGSTLAEQAASLGSQVADFANVSYFSNSVEGLGLEPRLVGAIATTTEKGSVSAPVKGLSGAYVFSVDAIQTADKQTAEGEKVRAQAMNENILQQMAIPAIQQMAEMKDMSGKFF